MIISCWLGFSLMVGVVSQVPPDASVEAGASTVAKRFVPSPVGFGERAKKPGQAASEDELAKMAEADPLGFLRFCRADYLRRDTKDYTCRFNKRENVGGRLHAKETIRVRCREKPFSVDMVWVKNASAAERAMYVEGAWKDKKGNSLAWVKPKGAILQLIVPKIKQPIHGKRARKAARRSIDQFGFRNTLDLLIRYAERAYANGELELNMVGEGMIDGRPTWVFERFLPYSETRKTYPDALLRYHIDREWLVPVACYAYADRAGKKLLGSYEFGDVRFNVGLTNRDFDPSKPGF